MEKLITDVLENGKKGWYSDLSDYSGQHERAKDIIREFEA